MRFVQESLGGNYLRIKGLFVKKRKKQTPSRNIVYSTLSLFIHIVGKTLLNDQKDRML